MSEKPLSFVERLKQKALQQQSYGGDAEKKEAGAIEAHCPNCGAGRAKQDGITHCAYCDFEFIAVKLEDGFYLRKEDNSKQ